MRRVYFKYCSTFDSTDAGNIGPVTDALLDAAGEPVTIICPAAPGHGRTLYNGHLFVGDRLLRNPRWRRHPLTPMTDPDIVRVLSRQTPHRVGLIPLSLVRRGEPEIGSHHRACGVMGCATSWSTPSTTTTCSPSQRPPSTFGVVTGSAGLAGALGKVLHDRDTGHDDPRRCRADRADGDLRRQLLAATLGQVEHAVQRYPSYRLDPRTVTNTADLLCGCAEWLGENLGATPV